ncbi:Mib_herc2 protein [Globodera pallida]|nr:Mib_herc2 protein [Globodera pallida]
MEGVDPDTLLEWLQMGVGDQRDLQLMALEQLCMTLLMSDNIDRCFESCPPRTFLPALGRIFLDETAPENILEVTARAITYYLDVSNECTRRITQVEGAIKAICHRLVTAEMTDRTSKDLGEQCVKLLEHICQREASSVHDAGGLQAMLHLIKHHDHLHKDTMHSAMAVVTKLCSKIEPSDVNLAECSKNLGDLLEHDDERVAECALRCFAAMTDRFMRRQMDPVTLAHPSKLVAHLFDLIGPPPATKENAPPELLAKGEICDVLKRNSAFISTVFSLFVNLCKSSSALTEEIISSPKLIPALKTVLNGKDERCINDSLRFIDLLIVLLCEGRAAVSKSRVLLNDSVVAPVFDKTHRNLIDAIRLRDTDALIDAVENGTVDPNFVDDVGQTLLNWCAAFGTSDMVIYLCDKGADTNKGQRSSSLHYAACFGRVEIVKILLRYGANADLQDEEGRTALDKARERSDEGHQQVCEILQNPGAYINIISTNALMHKLPVDRSQTDPKNAPDKDQIDSELSEKFIQQLLPLFCTIFRNSLAVGVRRTTLMLIRKCVFHISANAFGEVTEVKGNEMGEENGDFVESLVGVLMVVFESSENNLDAKEQALMTIKSLLIKRPEFWAEQLIRLGVYEKIEQLAKEAADAAANNVLAATRGVNAGLNSLELNVSEVQGTSNSDIMADCSSDKKESSLDKVATNSLDRSETSIPSASLGSESAALSNESRGNYPNEENVVHADSSSPSPTIEILHQHNSAMTLNNGGEIQPSNSHDGMNSPEFDTDLVDAANTIANVLGVQIVQDVSETSCEEQQQRQHEKQQRTAKDGSDDVWTVEEGMFYRWKDWRLIRTKDSMFLWCDAVALELSDGSNGWLRFLMNGRLSTLYSSGSPEYGADNAENRAEFVDKLHKARAAVPAGSQTKSILSVPRSATSTIQSGNWNLASAEVGTILLTNREGSQQKMVVKEDLPGFIFETSRHQKQLFTADSTLGHDFVTGWAARGGGRRLRYFRLEVQKQKVYELAREIWETYLKKARDQPREMVLEVQQCSNLLVKLTREIVSSETEGSSKTNAEDLKRKIDEVRTILAKIRDILIDERLLSVFEISISGLVPSFLEFIEQVFLNRNGTLAKCFAETFSDAKLLNLLVRKIVLVLEFTEKLPQYLYDAPGGSPFGFQLLTRRLRFRFELAKRENDSTDSKEFVNITNRFLKSEPLVTVSTLKSYLYEQLNSTKAFDNSSNIPKADLQQPYVSSALSNLSFGRPPTAASLRMARKLPKTSAEKLGGVSSAAGHGHKHTPGDVLSARSAYVAAGCLEKVGGSIKVKKSFGSGKTAKNVTAKKGGGTHSRSSGEASSKAQRNTNQRELSSSNEKASVDSVSGISQQQQKSMSTTNLFDADQRKGRSSSAAFKQAASAESLQHQTPSLENLLSKARLHDYSIPEESMGSPNSGSPEPKNLSTFGNLPDFETRFDKRKGSQDMHGLSIAASSFTGGSQPVLNSSSFSRDRSQLSSLERLEPNQIESSIETINEVSQKAEDDGTCQQLAQNPNSRFETQSPMDDRAQDDEDEEAEILSRIKETEDFLDLFSASGGRILASETGDANDATLVEVDEPLKNKIKAEKMLKKVLDKSEDDGTNSGETSSISPKEETHQNVPGTSGNSSSQIQNIGSNIRVKLGNYAEVFRNMMQQVLESGDNSDIYDVDEFDNDIYEDELHFIDDCEHPSDHGGGISISSDSSSVADRFADHVQNIGGAPATAGTNNGGSNTASSIFNDATSALQSQIESFTSVASALRRQFSSSASANQTIISNAGGSRADAFAAIRAAMERSDNMIPSLPIDVIIGTSSASETRNQRWRQALLEEFSTFMPPSMGGPNDGRQRSSEEGSCGRAIRTAGSKTSTQLGGWNDDFVLRRQFSALIPAFDPRPGRTNVNQTQDVKLPENILFCGNRRKESSIREYSKGETSSTVGVGTPTIRLFIKKTSKDQATKPEEEGITVEMKDDDSSLFRYVQDLLLGNQNCESSSDNIFSSDVNSQIWENTFTLIYSINANNEDLLLNDAPDKKGRFDPNLFGANPLVGQALNIIKMLQELSQSMINSDQIIEADVIFPSLPEESFHSTKLAQKLCQELADPLVVSAKTLPHWCNYLVHNFPCLFSMEIRAMYMNTTAFGTSRAIAYLQSRRDHLLEQNRSATASTGSNMAGLRREDHYPEYRIGRVKHERIKVHRSAELFLENAIKVLKFHAMRKAILEIEYFGEEGTGLGPTLEFFALVAADFQRRDLSMWHCGDVVAERGVAEGEDGGVTGSKPAGYYVYSDAGLFPAFWPFGTNERVLKLFQIFGVFIAKAIQDSRLVDLPFSKTFLKLITSPKLASSDHPSIESVLDLNDFALIYPEKVRLVRALLKFVERRKLIQSDEKFDSAEKEKMLNELRVEMDESKFSVEDLSLTFAVNAPAKSFPYECVELIDGGASVDVTAFNVEFYVKRFIEFHLNEGIREQIFMFRHGFDMVFPLSSLSCYSASELQTLLSGEQCPNWSREDLLRYTEPKLGYTRDSVGFLNFVDVLTSFSAAQRKAFLQFTTGCSSLPHGGLANLHPRLTIVRKVGSGDGSYPSVNTCVHYLKLPEYSNAEILKERLLAATSEKGFHLN